MSAPADPNYILSQEEFHRTVEGLKDGLDSRWRLSQATVRQEANGLRDTAGWIFVSLGLWALLIGFIIITGNEKGRP